MWDMIHVGYGHIALGPTDFLSAACLLESCVTPPLPPLNILLAAFTRGTPGLVMLAWKYPTEQTTVRRESGDSTSVLLQTKLHSSHLAPARNAIFEAI